MEKSVQQKLEQLFDEMVAVRRHLHMYPELSHQEVETLHMCHQIRSSRYGSETELVDGVLSG
jgi:metal-dependent amidase/aminoacylase/carboxypeptidase family protein